MYARSRPRRRHRAAPPAVLVPQFCRADLPEHPRVHELVAERPDRRHVGGPEQSVRFRVDGHLAAVATLLAPHPADVQHPVNGLVGDLRSPLVVEQVDRSEWQAAELGRRRIAQIRWQSVSERRHSGSDARLRAVPAEQFADLPPNRPEHPRRPRRLRRRIGRGHQRHKAGEVVGTTRRRERPDVFELKVAGQLVDSPRTRGVRGCLGATWLSLDPYGTVWISD